MTATCSWVGSSTSGRSRWRTRTATSHQPSGSGPYGGSRCTRLTCRVQRVSGSAAAANTETSWPSRASSVAHWRDVNPEPSDSSTRTGESCPARPTIRHPPVFAGRTATGRASARGRDREILHHTWILCDTRSRAPPAQLRHLALPARAQAKWGRVAAAGRDLPVLAAGPASAAPGRSPVGQPRRFPRATKGMRGRGEGVKSHPGAAMPRGRAWAVLRLLHLNRLGAAPLEGVHAARGMMLSA